MDPATRRAGSHIGSQEETGAASLTDSLQAAVGDGLVPESATVGIVDKFHQFPAFGKRPRSASASCAVTHNQSPFQFRVSPTELKILRLSLG